MLRLIINVTHVLITVNSSAHAVPVVFWELSHRKSCPVSFVKEIKMRTRLLSLSLFQRNRREIKLRVIKYDTDVL